MPLVPPPQNLPADVMANASAFYADFQPYLDRYAGGAPTGFLAAIAAREGAYLGRPWFLLWGDRQIGEYGYFQVEENFPTSIGLPAAIRMTPEGNIFCGALELNLHAADVYRRYASVLDLGSRDNWILARLAFGIGDGGLAAVMRAAQPRRGSVYADLAAWAQSGRAFAIPPMSKQLVASRILDAGTLWAVGMYVHRGLARNPELVPSPGNLKYRTPMQLIPFLNQPGGTPLLVAILASTLVL